MGPAWWRSSTVSAIGALQLMLVLCFLHGSVAQTTNCSITVLTPLLPCLPYVEAGNFTFPASDCCTPLSSIIQSSNPDCICQIAPLAAQNNIVINETRALEVATQCNQTVPASVKSCFSSVASAPTPSGTTPSPPPPPPSTSSPEGTGNSNPGNTLQPSLLVLISSSFVAVLLGFSMFTQ